MSDKRKRNKAPIKGNIPKLTIDVGLPMGHLTELRAGTGRALTG